MVDLIAIMIMALWPIKPIFWVPVHLMTHVFRRLGVLTHVVSLVIWLPLAFIIYQNKSFLLGYDINISLFLKITGWLLLISGVFLHLWAGRILGLWGLIGLPEVSNTFKSRLVIRGAFSVVRHPTYVAHTMIFSGVFLITGVVVVGIITILDIVLVLTLIIPFEERELLTRFGDEYRDYKERVPRFLPFKKQDHLQKSW